MAIELSKYSNIADTELGNKDAVLRNGSFDENHEVRTQTAKAELSHQELTNTWEKTALLIKSRFKISLLIAIAVAYFGYFSYAMYCEFGDEGSMRLLVCTLFGVIYVAGTTLLKNKSVSRIVVGLLDGISRAYTDGNRQKVIRWCLYIGAVIGCSVYIIINVALTSPGKLRSLIGMVVLVLAMALLSNNKRKIKWHTVFWGFIFQFLLGIFVLKSDAGKSSLKWAATRLEEYMENAKAGSFFLFGSKYMDHPFAFNTLPQIVLLCATIQVLVYIGTIPFLVRTVGRLVAFVLDVSAPEAINASANILLGGGESIMIVREYLRDMPVPQLFTVMTNGGSTCGGAALIQFMAFGIQGEYLLSSSIMSVPAALLCAKILIPDDDKTDADKEVDSETKDTQKQKNDTENQGGRRQNDHPEPKGIVEAMMLGTRVGVTLCANLIGAAIVFLSLVELLDGAVEWFGDRVNVQITMKMLLGYIFYPVAYIIGIDVADCKTGGELLGVKIISNPMLGYIDLGKLRDNRDSFEAYTNAYNSTDWRYDGADIFLTHWNQTLTNGYVSERSEEVLTYALCGFASLSSVGTILGSFAALAPERMNDVSRLVVPSLIGGTVASFLTACVAGLIA